MKKTNLVFLLLIFFCSSYLDQNDKDIEEYTAKAAFLYNFTKFINWDEFKGETFNIAVLKDCPIIEPLREIAQHKLIHDKKIKLVLVQTILPTNCQILFLPKKMNPEQMEMISQYYQGKQTLLITEEKGMLSLGSDINFLIQRHKIRFEVNLKALEQSKLEVSSQLLKLAVNYP